MRGQGIDITSSAKNVNSRCRKIHFLDHHEDSTTTNKVYTELTPVSYYTATPNAINGSISDTDYHTFGLKNHRIIPLRQFLSAISEDWPSPTNDRNIDRNPVLHSLHSLNLIEFPLTFESQFHLIDFLHSLFLKPKSWPEKNQGKGSNFDTSHLCDLPG